MFARRTAAVSGSDEQEASFPHARAVEDEIVPRRAVFVEAQIVKETDGKPRPVDPVQERLRHDDVGFYMSGGRRRGAARHADKALHQLSSSAASVRTSVSRPGTAAAATIAGLIRWVRPPIPCRPSKLRLVLDAQRSPGARLSSFIARQSEQPERRHSNPASMTMRSIPDRKSTRLNSSP